MTHLETSHALTARMLAKYPNRGFYLRPYRFGEELRFALAFTHDGDEVVDPNIDPWGGDSAEVVGFYGIDAEDCDSISAHNEPFGKRFDAPGPALTAYAATPADTLQDLRVATTTVAELVDFCEADVEWRPRGIMRGERFSLDATSRCWKIVVQRAKEPDMLESLVSVQPAVTLKVNGETVDLTWGEATELINALVLITAVGMFG